jgi:hypothetical protein
MHHRERTSLLTVAAIALAAPAFAAGPRRPGEEPSRPAKRQPAGAKTDRRAAAQRLERAAEDRRGMEAGRDAGAEPTIKNLPGLLERMNVKIEKSTIDGVRVFIVTPATIAPPIRTAC